MRVSALVGFHYHGNVLLSKKIYIKGISTCVASGLVVAPVVILDPIYDPHISQYRTI